MKLFVNSGNKKKLKELLELLGGSEIELIHPGDLPGMPEVAETGSTFEENATIKAVAASLHSGLVSLADDSGLEVDALGGAPGVRSARFAADLGDVDPRTGNASDAANRIKLLYELRAVPAGRRTARFRCAIAVARDGKLVLQSTGAIEGSILLEEHGAGGFGYDPLFVPEGHTTSFARMSPEEKSSISHRARALTNIKNSLLELLHSQKK